MVATSVAGYFLTHMPFAVRIGMALAGILLVAPGMKSDLYAVIVLIPVLAHQIYYRDRAGSVATGTT